MAFPQDAPGQNSSDLTEALGLLDAWKTMVTRCREVADTSYSPTLRIAATTLGALADGAVHALQFVFDALPHSDKGVAHAEVAHLYRPPLPEWRPGAQTEKGE